MVASGVLLGLSGTLVWADASSPGWVYGQQNCGKNSGVKSERECQSCCDAQFPDAGESTRDCYAFCGVVTWTPATPGWWGPPWLWWL